MDASRARNDFKREGVDVRALQLGDFAIFEDQLDNLMRPGHFFQYVGGGRIEPGGRLFRRRRRIQLQVLKERDGKLLR